MNEDVPVKERAAGLYEFGDGSPTGGIHTYFLTRDEPSSSQPPTFGEIWYSPAWLGWFVFLARPVTEASGFITAARAAFPALDTQQQSNPRGIVWATSPDALDALPAFVFYQLSVSPDVRTPIAPPDSFSFNWVPMTLVISAGVRVGFDFDLPAFLITTTPMDLGLITLSNVGQLRQYDSGGWSIRVPLTGAGAGGFAFSLGLDLGQMMQDLLCGQRFYQGPAPGDAASALAYPFYPPLAAGACFPGFSIMLHPLFATDPAWTTFALDLGESPANPCQQQSAALRAPYFSTTSGGAIMLAPRLSAGFAFCHGLSRQLYLAPIGAYEVLEIDVTGSARSGDGAAASWMCGLAGEEYLELRPGDILEFTAQRPAFSRMGATDGPLLDDSCTTSWLRFPNGVARRYFGQASASVYYAAATPGTFASPVEALLANLDAPTEMPLVPYGGIFSVDANRNISADEFSAFEAKVLTNERHARATAHAQGPVFLPTTARDPWRAGNEEDIAASAVTPQGFVVQLGLDGSWQQLQLARSPQDGSQMLTFSGVGSPAVVDKRLAMSLLQNELFLVISNASQLGEFANEIGMAGFNFTLDVGLEAKVGAHSTTLVFKFNTSATLEALVDSPAQWACKDAFVQDVAGTQAALLEAIAAARNVPVDSPPGTDPFVHFRQLASDPSWTGVLAFYCAIDGNGMPPDLQMLLGGVNGQLRAHHFGIQSNQLTYSSGSAEISASSLFGVIVYPTATQLAPPVDTRDPFDYEVEELHAVFENSRITMFNVSVGLTVNELFGRQVELVSGGGRPASPHNVLQIGGQYQVQDGIGTVTFNTHQSFVYRFPAPNAQSRVLQQVVFDSATLVPSTAQPIGSPPAGSPGGTRVQSVFSLAGALWFHPQPFDEAVGLDLFSYGYQEGLDFTGMAVNIAFSLDAVGAAVSGSKSVVGDITRLTPNAPSNAIRPASLLYSLPLQLSKFISSPAGLTAAALGANPVHVLQLEGSDRVATLSPVVSPLIRHAPPPPNVTTMPLYGLEFDMPLGSLGALSDVHVGLMAKLIIGWGPSRVVPGCDAAAVLVQLPQVFAGYGGFELQGILKTTFGDANLLRVDLDQGAVYALLFNNIKLSVLGYGFPPGLVVDFLIFAGTPAAESATNDSNLAWFLGVTQASASPPKELA